MTKEQLFQWCDDYRIGNEAIDQEHQFLFFLLREFTHAVRRNESDPESIVNAVNQLRDYTLRHFRNEEDLMLLYHSPDYEMHKKHHQMLLNQVDDIIDDFSPGYLSRLQKSLPFIEEWVKDHILKEDRKLVIR